MDHLSFPPPPPSSGIYLLMIAITDVRTVGVYFNYAIDWQHGKGQAQEGEPASHNEHSRERFIC